MEREENRYHIPAVALRGMTILPDMIIHFDLSRKKSILAVEQSMAADQMLLVVTQKDPDTEEPQCSDLYEVGTVVSIRQLTKLPGDVVRVLAEGKRRVLLRSFVSEETAYLLAEIEETPAVEQLGDSETEAALREIRAIFDRYSQCYPKVGKNLAPRVQEINDLEVLIDEIASSIPLQYTNKQKILEELDLRERFSLLCQILLNEVEVARVRSELTEKIRSRVEKNQKEYLLREQLHFIREELGEENTMSDADQFAEDLNKCKASKEVKEKIKKEIARFRNIAASSSESAVERGYIETLLSLPWDNMSEDNTDITRAETILEEEHYGLEKVKERILEFLAVRSLTHRGDSPILCLVGPPGTGKTSIARSVARALDKRYIRICLGGVRDEAEIRGHRRTYVGAMPGRIAAGLRQAGVRNPLMLLDEIDKVGSDQRGDTASALLEVLDGEQNNKFRDHYVEIPIDLSEVLFLATANSVSTIPRPLLDRMEIIEVTSYTANEKFHIAKEHLLGKQLEKNGLTDRQLTITDHALQLMIERYTREAGVRELERKIGQICRKVAREILQTDKDMVIRVTKQNLEKYLGKEKYAQDRVNEKDEVGIVRGLAWTSVGGDTLEIEVNIMPGKGEIDLTGQMGEVMKESAIAGISFIRSVAREHKIAADVFRKNDFHIHIPEGAVPKDGPSAGITMATAVFSALTKRPVYASVAMTGEITLRGRVLPIGGLKEKILAAKTAGIKKVLVPRENKKDVEEISQEIKSGVEIVYVAHMEEVLKHALGKKRSQASFE
ncbi:endopeptidase La [Lachnospiraceae bacterium JLR.KK008]